LSLSTQKKNHVKSTEYMQAGLYTTANVILRQFACQKVKDAIPRLKSKKEPSDDA